MIAAQRMARHRNKDDACLLALFAIPLGTQPRAWKSLPSFSFCKEMVRRKALRAGITQAPRGILNSNEGEADFGERGQRYNRVWRQ